MKVIPLALIVLASVLATLATILYVSSRGEKIRAETALALAEANVRNLENEATARKAQIASLETQVAELAQVRQQLRSNEQQVQDLKNNLAQGRNILLIRQRNESLLNQEIADLNRKLSAADLQASEIVRCKARIDELEQILAILHRKGIAIVPNASTPAASILGVGPDNSFIIINLGRKHGISPNQKLFVRRGTDVIATVLTSEVREELSIAQVDPFQLREALRKGDFILLDQ
jgi:cell shape-determining protein MreC